MARPKVTWLYRIKRFFKRSGGPTAFKKGMDLSWKELQEQKNAVIGLESQLQNDITKSFLQSYLDVMVLQSIDGGNYSSLSFIFDDKQLFINKGSLVAARSIINQEMNPVIVFYTKVMFSDFLAKNTSPLFSPEMGLEFEKYAKEIIAEQLMSLASPLSTDKKIH